MGWGWLGREVCMVGEMLHDMSTQCVMFLSDLVLLFTICFTHEACFITVAVVESE